jgi:hypothetical protein
MTRQPLILTISRLGWAAALAYAVLHVTGCNTLGSTELRMSGDTRLDDELANAGQAWCNATRGACCPTVMSAGEVSVTPVDAALIPCAGSDHATGCYSRKGPTVVLTFATAISDERLYRTALHELGHVCRATVVGGVQGHIGAGNTMAVGTGEQPGYITDVDVAYATGG